MFCLVRKSKKGRKAKSPVSTFMNKPLDSIMAHIGKKFDQASVREIMDLLVHGIVALYAWRAVDPEFNFERIDAGLAAVSIGTIGYRLALSANLPAGTAGVAILSGIGLVNLLPSLEELAQQNAENRAAGWLNALRAVGFIG